MRRLHAGLDVADKTTVICVVDAGGASMFEATVATEPAAIDLALRPLRSSLALVGLETGNRAHWLYKELTRLRYPMRLLDAGAAHGALKSRLNKTDENDALGLARLLASGIFELAHVRSDEAIRLRAFLSIRRVVQRKATDLRFSLQTSLKHLGEDRPVLRLGRGRKNPDTKNLAALATARQAATASMRVLQQESRKIEKAAVALANENEVCRRFMTIPGVGPITALTFFAAIDDPYRFKSSRDVGAYLGMTPRVFQSGTTTRMGGISHAGDGGARTVLYIAAQVLLINSRSKCKLRTWGLALRKAKGFKPACLAVARKLAVLMHHLWVTGQEFDPSR